MFEHWALRRDVLAPAVMEQVAARRLPIAVAAGLLVQGGYRLVARLGVASVAEAAELANLRLKLPGMEAVVVDPRSETGLFAPRFGDLYIETAKGSVYVFAIDRLIRVANHPAELIWNLRIPEVPLLRLTFDAGPDPKSLRACVEQVFGKRRCVWSEQLDRGSVVGSRAESVELACRFVERVAGERAAGKAYGVDRLVRRLSYTVISPDAAKTAVRAAS